jgi:hypothetical protein
MIPDRGRLLALGVFAWIAIMGALWPLAASFADEIGYLGEARLVLDGRLRPQPTDIGVWRGEPADRRAQYPLFPSLLFAPLQAVSPRAVFALGVISAVVACLIAARVLRSWDNSPAWAVIILAHPTVIIIARTATADLPLCAFMLAVWWSLRRDHFRAAVPLFAALFAIKSTGFLIGTAIAAGELLRRLPDIRRGEASGRRAVASVVAGLTLGAAVVAGANWLTTGGFWFGYDHRFLGVPPFWFSFFASTAPAQLRTVLLLPPLLIAGAVPFWRRREFGPLFVIFGFGGLMCFYFFVDTSTNWIESWVLAPRLLLPVVVFLLIGYAHLLASLARLAGADRWMLPLLAVGTVALALAVSLRHQEWQRPMGAAIEAAKRISAQTGVRELASLPQAAKAAIMFPGPVRYADPRATHERLVLCSVHGASYRLRHREGAYSCALPGYRVEYRAAGYEVLVPTGNPAAH